MLGFASVARSAIVVNGDFEIEDSNPTDALSWTGENGTTIARTVTGGVSGTAGALISNTIPVSAAGPLRQNTGFAGGDPVIGGTSYTFSFDSQRTFANGGVFQAQLVARDDGNNPLAFPVNATLTMGNAAFETFSQDFIAPVGTTRFEINFFAITGADAGSSSSVVIDNVQIIPEPSSCALLLGGIGLMARRRFPRERGGDRARYDGSKPHCDMNEPTDYFEINRKSWNARTSIHIASDFYGMPAFREGATSLIDIELRLLGDVAGKSILHLQCHFGQDTLSLARLGAKVTGVDLSDVAISEARKLANELAVSAEFVCCNVYDLEQHLDGQFDVVFTSYGAIGWLPDLARWAHIVRRFLKPGGRLVLVEFHPFVWMFDERFHEIKYPYFNRGPIVESSSGTYADRTAPIEHQDVGWNHPLSEVLGSLMASGLSIRHFQEYDYSPYGCFETAVRVREGVYRVPNLGDKIPMLYSVVAEG